MTSFGSVITAMVTPFDSELNVNLTAAARLAGYLVEHGSDTILVCGTTGESPTLSHQEKLDLFRTVKSAVGDRARVLAGTGSNNTRTSIELTGEAEQMGLDGVLLVTPYYNKPPVEGLFRHFSDIAKSTRLPVMLYNIPGRTGVKMDAALIGRLSRLPNVVAVKEACGDVEQVSAVVQAVVNPTGEERYPVPFAECQADSAACSGFAIRRPGLEHAAPFVIYSGDDSLTLPMLAVGAAGVISVVSHVAGREIKHMVEAFFKGQSAEAAAIHHRLYPLFKGLFITTNPIPVKAALNIMGFEVGGLRPPLLEATAEQQSVIRKLLERTGLLAAVA